VPGHGLVLLGLAEALEQADAAAIGVERVHVVDDHELVAVAVELGVHAKRRGVALDPARFSAEHGPRRAALGQAAGAHQHEQMEMPLGEGPQILLQPLVGGDVQRLVRLAVAALSLGTGRHGGSPANAWELLSSPLFGALPSKLFGVLHATMAVFYEK
jgi:hypothetical protein